MPPPKVRPLAVMLGDQAVEAMYALARDVRSAAPMRQQPLFGELDEPWLDAARRGIVCIVLRVAFVLHAEATGVLPLGQPGYDAFALSPLGAARHPSGAWKRLVRLSRVLSGAARPPSDVAIPFLGSAVFEDRWLGALAPGASQELELVPSDHAIHTVVRLLCKIGKAPIPYADVAVEQIAALYERLIGFAITRCTGRSLRMGTSRTVVDLDALVSAPSSRRAAMLAEQGLKPGPQVLSRIESASSFDEMLDAVRGRRRAEVLLPGAIVLQPNLARRRAGAHYTPPEIARGVVEAALQPLIDRADGPDSLLALRICDPSMGTGGFLVEACRVLAGAVTLAWQRAQSAEADGVDVECRARFAVASQCICGVDLDPLAVDLARVALQLAAVGPSGELPQVEHNLRCGDALLGLGPWVSAKGDAPDEHLVSIDWIPGGKAALRSAIRTRQTRSCRPRVKVQRVRTLADRYVHDFLAAHASASPKRAVEVFRRGLLTTEESPQAAADIARRRPFHWPLEFPEVFSAEPAGFDAFVGNPPWVAFAGRAAQPLEKAQRGYFIHVSAAFRGYRTLQGLFVHRCASLLRPGGRLGLVVPTSMSDLDGYAPVRKIHDALCDADEDLPDFGGHAFDGVFQPSMALLSTRKREAAEQDGPAVWSVRREDLEPWASALLERLARLPSMPSVAFSERGFQSRREDAARIRAISTPDPPFILPLREGTDVRAFEVRAPRMHMNPEGLEGRLRSASHYAEVAVLVRQTARYPIAALADGLAFRNSLLAGFAFEGWSAGMLVAYLNAWPTRWIHYMRHRDARQGMPQVKISHLRSLPLPRLEAAQREHLADLGGAFGRRNQGISADEQGVLDALVGEILGICSNDLDAIAGWRADKGFS